MKKSFGQHFLKDEAVIDVIITASNLQPGELIVEVGPGAGALTNRLAQFGNPLILIEADRDLLPKLATKYSTAQIIQADAAQVDYDAITQNQPWLLVSNLPYNAANAILEQVYRAYHAPRQLIVMVQKEVGDRMMAVPGEMSVLSVATQLYCSVERICSVPPSAFVPAPQVDSVVLRLVPRAVNSSETPSNYPLTKKRNSSDIEAVIALAKIGFAHRRKQLRQTLSSSGLTTLEAIDRIFVSLSISRTARPQELSLEQWVKLRTLIS